eukprot:g29620.t1
MKRNPKKAWSILKRVGLVKEGEVSTKSFFFTKLSLITKVSWSVGLLFRETFSRIPLKIKSQTRHSSRCASLAGPQMGPNVWHQTQLVKGFVLGLGISFGYALWKGCSFVLFPASDLLTSKAKCFVSRKLHLTIPTYEDLDSAAKKK